MQKSLKNTASNNPTASALPDKLLFFTDKYANKASALQQLDAKGLQAKIREILDKICDLKCLEQKGIKIADVTPLDFAQHLSKLKGAKERITGFVKGKYYQTLDALLTDIRIFAGLNTFIFLVLFAVLAKSSFATRPLLLPSVLMLIATGASISIYIFGQNWFYTIIFNNYMGYGYLAYVGIIFAFLIDIVYNKATITESILSRIADILSCIPTP